MRLLLEEKAAVGEEALILGPFTPPVVTLLGLTKIGYGEMILDIICCGAYCPDHISWSSIVYFLHE